MSDRVQVRVVETDGSRAVLSPGVGWWSGLPRNGALVDESAEIGTLRRLHRKTRLTLPPGIVGRIVGIDGAPLRRAVGFGDLLFRLEEVGDFAEGPARDEPSRGAAQNLAPGEHAILAPTDGVFYGRPSPDAPAFNKVGDRVRRGQPIGLVEVMKTFNQIRYEGEDLPDEAEVVEIRPGDGDEIAAGSVMLVVRSV